MAATIKLPAIFSVIDRLSRPVAGMGRAVSAFAERSRAAGARLSRGLSRVSNAAMTVSKRTGAIGLAIAGALSFAAKEAIGYEKSLGSFRTIVSDLNDQQFAPYKQQIESIGDSTGRTYNEVAESFEKIAGLNADFAKTADGLGLVSKASIILSKASGEELGPSAESLVGIMNQFGLAADQADRTINVLAAGTAAGAASIAQSAEAYVNFGSVAKGANITLEQSQALIQTLGKFSLFGAEAGTKLRGSILQLQKAGMGYKSGQFQINDALEEAKKKVDGLKTAKEQDAYLTKVFGAENITTGRILLSNIDVYNGLTQAVTGTSEAQKAADIRSKTTAERFQEVKNRAMNLAVTIGENLLPVIQKALDHITPIIKSVADWTKRNPELTNTIVMVATVVAGLLLTISALSFVIGIVTKATMIWQAAQLLLNLILTANPIGIIIIAIAGLIAIIVTVVKNVEGWGEQWDAILSWMKSVFKLWVLSIKMQWLILKEAFYVLADALVSTWYWAQNKIGLMSDETYNKNMAQIEAEKKARIAAIKETAIAMKQEAVKIASGPGWKLRLKSSDDETQAEIGAELGPAQVINKDQAKQEASMQAAANAGGNKSQVELLIKDMTGSAQVSKNPSGIPIKTSSTLAQFYKK